MLLGQTSPKWPYQKEVLPGPICTNIIIIIIIIIHHHRHYNDVSQVVNCYLEAYHHTLNATQRTNLHQSIATVMQARPRYDIDAFYFTELYRKEVKCLDTMGELLLGVINYQMTEERAYNQLVCHPGG